MRPPAYDHTASWHEIVEHVLEVCTGAGKTIAGQEARPGSMRAAREVSVETFEGDDTTLQRRTPATEWAWRLVLLFRYPGRNADGAVSRALQDVEPVAAALTTSNPKRGWRVHVSGVRGRSEKSDVVVRLLVTVERAYWYVGGPVGQDGEGVEAGTQDDP